jgi:hypothetical protein
MSTETYKQIVKQPTISRGAKSQVFAVPDKLADGPLAGARYPFKQAAV